MDKSYSQWQRIDLHIHTDWSKKTKQGDYRGNFSVEVLHERLIDENVEIFSLTDHNIINLDAYKEYYENYNSSEDPLLLLGVELDIKRKEKTYHSLLIFKYSCYAKAQYISEKLENVYSEKNLELKRRTINIDRISDIFSDDDFFLIPHAGNTASIVEGYKGEIEEAQKMLILFQSPLEKVPEKRRQIYNENFDKVLYEAFRNKDDYAYIEFSDNHNINKYPCTHKGDNGDHEFYYIKGSKNYETLRLAFIDPKSRILSSSEFNALNNSRNYIESFDIKSDSKVRDKTLNFSPHLNVIIGGRSSGKSLLIDAINRCIDTLKKHDKYDSILNEAEMRIKSRYDESSKTKTSIDTSIVQINQGDIANYFENNNLEELAKKTGKIDKYNEAKENFITMRNNLQSIINDLTSEYKRLYDINIDQKFVIHDHNINKLLSDEFLIKVDEKEIKNTHDSLEGLTESFELVNGFSENIEQLKESQYILFTDEEKETVEKFKKIIINNQKKLQEKMSNRKKIDLLLENTIQIVKNANSNLNEEGKEKAEAKQLLMNSIDNIEKQFRLLTSFKKYCDNLENYDYSHVESIKLDSKSELCLETIKKEEIGYLVRDAIKDDVGSDNSLYLSLLNLLYNLSSVKNYTNNKPESLRKKINSQLESIFNSYENPNDFLKYNDGTNSKENSPGYNSEKFLQVILKDPSSNLILIDQPEDNLGKNFISEELVDLIRELKFEKQFFLVTHNPAIVVYGDAESIILSRNNDDQISYEQIKLESEFSQKEVCKILDGGEYIFDNRARKYNIKKLLRGES